MKNNMVNVLRTLACSTFVTLIDNRDKETVIQRGIVLDIMENDYTCYDAVDFIFTSNDEVIICVEPALKDGKEYYFRVGTSAEGNSYGYVKLTPEQARAVAFACDANNWFMPVFEGFSGSFYIDLDDWKTVTEVEK